MGNKGSKPQVQQTTQTQTQNASVAPDPYVLQQLYSTLGKAQKAASTPFQAYTGELTAGLTPTQLQAISGLGGIQQQFTQAGQPISAEDIQRYQNPYQQQVIDATQAAFNRQNAVGLNQLRGGLAAQNAFGNSRAGIAEGSYLAGQAAQQNPVIANLYSQGYQGALSAAQADRQAQLAAAQSGITGQQALLGAGTLEQQTQQAANTAQYEQYLRAQGYPFETAQYLASILGGIGGLAGTRTTGTSTGTGTTTTTPPQPSMLGQIAGLGAAALSFIPGGQPFAMGLGALGALSKAAGGSAGGDAPLYRRSYIPAVQLGRGPGLQPAQAPQLHMDTGNAEPKSIEPSTQDWAKLGKELGGIDWSGVSGSLSNAGQALSSFSLPGGLADGGRVAPSLAPGTVADSFDDRFGEWSDSFDDRFNALATPGVGVRSGGDDGFDAFYLRDLPVHRSPPEHFLSPTPVRYAADGGVMGEDDDIVNDLSIPAPIRYNNPGGMWPGASSRRFGATGSGVIGGGNKIARFPTPSLGASAQFDLLSRGYSNMALKDAIAKWSGGNDPGAYVRFLGERTGLGPTTTLSPELLKGPQGLALAKAMARWETGRDYPLSDDEWAKAQEQGLSGAPVMARGGDDDELPPSGPASPADANSGIFSSPGIFGISPRGREALLAAGLGMLASRNPNALGAIGEGALSGLGFYQSQQKANLDRALKDAQMRMHAENIAESRADRNARFSENQELRKQIHADNIQAAKERAAEAARVAEEARKEKLAQRPLPSQQQKFLGDKGAVFNQLGGLTDSFKDGYGGSGVKQVGELENWVARQFNIGNTEAADWWGQYQRYANAVRHEFFGSALTATEQAQWEKADVNPGMAPERIKANIKAQHAIVAGALKRRAASLLAQGFNKDAIEAELGTSVEDLDKRAMGAKVEEATKTAPTLRKPTDDEKGRIEKKLKEFQGPQREGYLKHLRDNGLDTSGF